MIPPKVMARTSTPLALVSVKISTADPSFSLPNGARVTTNVENVDLRPDPSEFELPAGAQRVEAL